MGEPGPDHRGYDDAVSRIIRNTEAGVIDRYIEHRQATEPPYIYHRWSCMVSIAALLGRRYYFPFGDTRIYPNLYCMFIGDPGSRKSTAIKMAKRTLSATGYESFAADKTSKEKFLLDLEGSVDEGVDLTDRRKNGKKVYDAIMSENLWGPDSKLQEPKEVYIVADEFNEFAGTGNVDFYTTLGNLWDWDDESLPFKQRLKNSKSVHIWQPTINILAGNTPELFARAFPPETIGTGFLSRMILIYGEKSERRNSKPPVPDEEEKQAIIRSLVSIRDHMVGPATATSQADRILDLVYNGWIDIDDVRFKSYGTRRYTQLIKICLIISASKMEKEISEETVIYANTIMAAAEHNMPKALGEFGKSKNSDVVNKIMDILLNARKPMSSRDIWKLIHSDLEKPSQLAEMMVSLQTADKVQYVASAGYLPKKSGIRKLQFVDFSLLTEEERSML